MAKKVSTCAVIVALSLLLSGSAPVQREHIALQKQLEELQQRGFSYRFLDNNMVEITELLTGAKQLKNLNEPSEAEIRAWAAVRGIPILEIDPRAIDTTRFADWFRYGGRVPVGMPGSVDNVIVGDIDGNTKPEVYGFTRIFPNPEVAISEATTESTSTHRYTYQPYPGVPIGLTDVDRDFHTELATINYFGTTTISFFEQQSGHQLPTQFRFAFPTAASGGETVGFTPLFGFFDQDSLVDCLFRTIDTDSIGNTVRKVAIAEYDTTNHRLERIWEQPLLFEGGFTVGDFDQDGRSEFATPGFASGGRSGKLFVFENSGNNSFRMTYQDSTPFVNYYGIASGDVDGDGKPEIFSEANMETDWVLVHEADGNDHFSLKLLIHFSTGSGFNVPAYFTRDIDGDGRQELVLTTGPYILIMKGSGDNTYTPWYMRRETDLRGIQFTDLNRDGRMDLAVTSAQYDTLSGFNNYFTRFYLNSRTTSFSEGQVLPSKADLFANYPNPFNPATTIEYSIPTSQVVRLFLFDILGRRVRVLVDGFQESGLHKVKFNANGLASGVYFYQLQAGSSVITKKLILAR